MPRPHVPDHGERPFPIYDIDVLRAAISLPELIEPVAQAFVDFSRGDTESPSYVLHPSEHGDVHVKSAAARGRRHYVVKVASWFGAKQARGASPLGGFIAVCDAETGDLVALLCDDHYLSDLRTAAAGAVVARALAPDVVTTAGVLGTGVQAHLQVLALAQVRPFETLHLWGRHEARTTRLAHRLQDELPNVRCLISFSPEDVVGQSDVVVAATASREPLVRGAWLRPGQHLTAVGADDDLKCELDAASLARADRLIVDSREANMRFGDVHRACSRGELRPENIHGEIGEVLAGVVDGRRSPTEITIAKLVGLGVQDLVVAELALEKLRAIEGSPRGDRA